MKDVTLDALSAITPMDMTEAGKKPAKAVRLMINLPELEATLAKASGLPGLREIIFYEMGMDSGAQFAFPADLSALAGVISLNFQQCQKHINFARELPKFAQLPGLKRLVFDGCRMTLERLESARLQDLATLTSVVVKDATGPAPGSLLTKKQQAQVTATLGVALPETRFSFSTPFDDFESLTELGSELCEPATAQIEDAALKKLYWHLKALPYRSYAYAMAHLDDVADKLAALEGARHGLNVLRTEYSKLKKFKWADERIAAEYPDDYFGHDLPFFSEQIAELSSKVDALRASGASSRVYSKYERHEQLHAKNLESEAAAFMADLEADESLEKKIHAALGHIGEKDVAPADKVMAALTQAQELKLGSEAFTVYIRAATQGAARALKDAGQPAEAKKLEEALGGLVDRLYKVP